jgi:hypothetical protein
MNDTHDDILLLHPAAAAHTTRDSCAICLGELGGGAAAEPVHMIRSCQHTFHPTCLTTWLARKAECPLCRSELPSLQVAARERAFLEQIQDLVALLQRDTHLTQSIVTYTVIESILRRFTTSIGRGGLREAAEQVRAAIDEVVVNTVRPFPVACESRYGLQTQARNLRRAIAEGLGCLPAHVHRHQRVQRIRDQLQLALPLPHPL